MSRLRFEIEGEPNRISLPTYSEATQRVVQILRELDVAISGRGGPSLNWYVTDVSKNGSLGIEVQSRVRPSNKANQPRIDVSGSVAESFVTTFENIQDRGISPPYLSEFGIQKLQRMVSLLRKNGATAFRASSVDRNRSVTVDESAEKTLNQLIPTIRTYEGTVEGRLETISVHKETRFIIYHAISKKAVTCKIERDADLDSAKQALGKKVAVSGIVSINVKGEPLHMTVLELRILGRDKILPLAADLTGADPDFTGSLSTEEYIRSIRRG